MKRMVFLFICSLSLVVTSACGSISQNTIQSEQVSADLPVYSFAQLAKEKSELIILATVKSVSEIREKNSNRVVQESVLEVEKQLGGNISSEQVILHQSVDKVQLGKSYLLFLQYRPQIDRYVVVDGNSQIYIDDIKAFIENNSTLNLTYEDVKGKYRLNELIDLLKTHD